MLNVSITLNTKAYDKYSRSGAVKGNLSDTIALIAKHIDITEYDADHSSELAHIHGTTTLTLIALSNALYSDENFNSRIKRLHTNLDLLELSTRPQAHVPTEEEITSAINAHDNSTEACTCRDDPDYCKLHA